MTATPWSRDYGSDEQSHLAIVLYGCEPSSDCLDRLHACLGEGWSTRWISDLTAESAKLHTLEGNASILQRVVTRNSCIDTTLAIAGWNIPTPLVQELAYQLLGQDRNVEAVVAVLAKRQSQWLSRSCPGIVHAADSYVEKPSPLPLRVIDVGEFTVDSVICSTTQLAAALKEGVAALRAKPQREYNPLVTIRSGGSTVRNAIVCIPGAGDSVTSFLELSGYMRESAIFGLQPRGLDNGLVPNTTAQSAAFMYLRSLEAHGFQQPIHLVGHSFGGWVAFEIALEMQRRGMPPGSVTLIDSDPPNREDTQFEYTFDETLVELSALLELSAGRPLRLDQRALTGKTAKAKFATLHQRMTSASLLPSRSRPEVIEGMIHALRRGIALLLSTFGATVDTPEVGLCACFKFDG